MSTLHAFQLYEKSKKRLARGGFQLLKFITNSEELQRLVHQNETQTEDRGAGQGELDIMKMEEPESH